MTIAMTSVSHRRFRSTRITACTALLVAAGLLGSAPVHAQSAPAPVRLRAQIVSFEAPTLVIKRDNGEQATITLAGDANVSTVKNVPLMEVKPGSYVGVAARAGRDGKMTAIEVLVFPEAMRGANEGHYPWDLTPESTMTNASVTSMVTANSQHELQLTYKDGAKTIVVPPNVPVVTFAPAAVADLLPGKRVFVVGVPGENQRYTSRRVVVEKDGVAPPM